MKILHALRSEAALLVADAAATLLDSNPSLHIVLATGSSPESAYRQVAARRLDWSMAWVTQLDEWHGIPREHPATCETFLRREVLEPWNVSSGRFLGWNAAAEDPEAECIRFARELAQRPSIDLAILGVGRNGHLGLNEPSDTLSVGVHVSELAEQTRSHGMLAEAGNVRFGMTMGLADILSARRILVLVSGSGKRAVLDHLVAGRTVTTKLPASMLLLHPDTTCLVESDSTD